VKKYRTTFIFLIVVISGIMLLLYRWQITQSPVALSAHTNLVPQHNSSPATHLNPVQQENQLPGTTKWQLTRPASYDTQTSRFQAIEGYAWTTSVAAGDTISFSVSTAQPTYGIQIYRMGWYGGAGSRLIKTISNLPGIHQPIPTPDPTTGLIEAKWQSTYTLKTQNTWTSGVYLAQLIAANGSNNYIIFVVRQDTQAADIVYQIPVTTYQAYNNWGGKSLYGYNSTDGIGAYKVSFDRPYAGDEGAGSFFEGDYTMIRFLESKGYNVTYVTSVDTQTNPNLMKNRKVFLSNYHDEYWAAPMRDHLINFINQGKHAAFFGANNIYWQIRFENSTSGVANRVIICYRKASLDPMSQTHPSLTTVRWREAPVNKPENALLGLMFESAMNWPHAADWVVTNANHWIYNGTGLHNGDTIPRLVGYEFDGIYNNGLTPAGLITLSASPVTDSSNHRFIANSSIYTASSNAMVFTAGTIFWSWEVDNSNPFGYPADSRVQLMTSNILDTMIRGSIPNAGMASEGKRQN